MSVVGLPAQLPAQLVVVVVVTHPVAASYQSYQLLS
jgi:hypothetical protein